MTPEQVRDRLDEITGIAKGYLDVACGVLGPGSLPTQLQTIMLACLLAYLDETRR